MLLEAPLWLILALYLSTSIFLYSEYMPFLFGVIVWTLWEYVNHRYIFHGPLKAYHRVHHMNPAKHRTLPLGLSMPVAFIFWFVLPAEYVAGFIFGYAQYEIIHWVSPAWHNLHHIDSMRYYSVSTPIWDWIFRTA